MVIKKINIAEPCNQSWKEMATVSGDRHCESCSKTVVDFTKMSNDEIINYLSVHNHVCGRVREQQMHSINLQLTNRQPRSKGGWTRWVAAATIFAGAIYNRANAQPPTHLTEQTDSLNRQKTADTPVSHPVEYRTITGVVVDEDNLPLPGVSVVVDRTSVGTQTNDDGKFTLRVPISARKLRFIFVGFEMMEIKLKKVVNINKIQLKMKPAMLGGLGVTRSLSIRQLYAGFVQSLAGRKLNREI